MKPTDRRKALKEQVDKLSDERLRVAEDFLAYLGQIESAEATDELLAIPGLVDQVRAAKEEATSETTTLGDMKWKQ